MSMTSDTNIFHDLPTSPGPYASLLLGFQAACALPCEPLNHLACTYSN